MLATKVFVINSPGERFLHNVPIIYAFNLIVLHLMLLRNHVVLLLPYNYLSCTNL